MKAKLLFRPSALRFKHFSRQGYALFASLGKVVLIGVLSVSTLKYAKANSLSVETETHRDSLVVAETTLEEVEVLASPALAPPDVQAPNQVVLSLTQLSEQAAATSVNDALKGIAAVDVRQRGANSVQTDIGIRGSTFDEIGVSINGVPFTSPQTGHLAADLPLSIEDIQSVEIIKGATANTLIPNALCGIINLTTIQNTNSTKANIHFGSYGTANVNANTNVTTEHFQLFAAAGYTRSDGATENSAYQSARTFLQASAQTKGQRIALQASFSYKPYEANTFYGSGSREQWEANERVTTAITADLHYKSLSLTPQFAFNRSYDHYQWVHHSPGGENFHQTTDYTFSLHAQLVTAIGSTELAVANRQEAVYSTSLGVPLSADSYVPTHGISSNDSVSYTHHDARNITSGYLQHSFTVQHLAVALTVNGVITNRHQRALSPSARLTYSFSPALTAFAQYNQALRLPTFTDLYYSGANIEGNSALAAERGQDIEIGIRYATHAVQATVEGYYTHKKNMIDWVIFAEEEDDIYRSTNFILNAWGVDFDGFIDFQKLLHWRFPLESITLSYAYIYQKSQYKQPIAASKYAMEYLRNKVTLHTHWHIWRQLTADLDLRVHQRIGADNPSYALVDGKLTWQARHYSLFVNANNILSHRYFDYIDVPQPRFTFIAGILVHV